MTIQRLCVQAPRHLGVLATVVLLTLMVPGTTANGHSDDCYAPGEAGRLQYLLDTRTGRYGDRNVFRNSRQYSPLRNAFRSSRHYQQKLASSRDSYVLRVFHHGNGRGHHGRHRVSYGGVLPGVYGRNARCINPYANYRSPVYVNQTSTRPAHDCDACRTQRERELARSKRQRERLDPRDIEYRVIHVHKPEPTQRPVLETITKADGTTRTVIRSVPLDTTANDTALAEGVTEKTTTDVASLGD